jgi:Bacterial protein of unknown function (DUF853)
MNNAGRQERDRSLATVLSGGLQAPLPLANRQLFSSGKRSPDPGRGPRDYVADAAVPIGCSRQGGALVPEAIELAQANRHGLVTGGTGTGKTACRSSPRGSRPPAFPSSPRA